jgi:hypothetical protein
LEIKPSLEEQIKDAQKQDFDITLIKKNIASGDAKCFSLDHQYTVYFVKRLVVLNHRD